MPITVERSVGIEVAATLLEASIIRPPLFDVKKEEIVGTGRDRFANRLLSTLTRGISHIKDFIYRKGRGGRGPCPGCINGAEDGHHGGSQCRRRGKQGFSLKPQITFNSFNIGKLASKSSGLYQF